MSDEILFRGIAATSGPPIVLQQVAGVERPLAPPVGRAFDWGHMSESVSVLARAMAEVVYPTGSDPAAADLIKRHFLTSFKRGQDWQLSSREIRAYVDRKRTGVSA